MGMSQVVENLSQNLKRKRKRKRKWKRERESGKKFLTKLVVSCSSYRSGAINGNRSVVHLRPSVIRRNIRGRRRGFFSAKIRKLQGSPSTRRFLSTVPV